IEKKQFPSWKVNIQIMPHADALKYRYDVFDITKVWPHKDYPLIPVGRMVLNRNPENYFAEVEQSAFSPGNFVPGIAASPDKLLQGRLFSYHDTHRHRLGPNYHLIPVNQPKKSPESNYQRDSFMRVDENGGGAPNYYPNTQGGPAPDGRSDDPPMEAFGHIDRTEYDHPNSDFEQAGMLYRKVMSKTDRDHLIGNIVAHLGNAQKRFQLRQAAIFYKADEEYGRRVAEGLKLDLNRVKKLAAMTQEERVKETLK
ncbi:MAG: catalase, partial [candidate division Zixibacteria bacterium]|nr:catalase [candidate division Zixibacteria bacterium]